MSGVLDYGAWRFFDYRPAIAALSLDSLIPHLPGIKTALDIGCNTGGTALFLAKLGIKVLGVDINGKAIRTAQQCRVSRQLGEFAEFRELDVLESTDLGLFDLVLLVRTLTCIPELSSWKHFLRFAHMQLNQSGLIYVHDFLMSPELSNYGQRYSEGLARGWRPGNFMVKAPSGVELFVAHHHSDEEVREISMPYDTLHFQIHRSLSMNGNECKMFQFIGRKAACPGSKSS